MTNMPLLRRIAVLVGLALAGSATAQSIDGPPLVPKLDLGGFWTEARLGSPLNPDNFTGTAERIYNFDARLGFGFEGGEVLGRLSWEKDQSNLARRSRRTAQLLQAHWTFEPRESILWTVGKKNLHFDAGYAFHPLDFLEDLSTVGDFEQWRTVEEGFPLVSLAYRWSGATLSVVYSSDFETESKQYNRGLKQALVALETSGNAWDATFLVQKYSVGRPGVGASTSLAVSDGLSLHAGFFSRQGSLRPFYGTTGQTVTDIYPNGSYSVGRWRTDDKKWFSKLLIGGQYTFASKVNVLAEYFFDGEGVAADQWAHFQEQISTAQRFTNDAARRATLVNGLRALSSRRQHYGLVRLQFNDLPLRPEMSVLVGEDKGGQLNLKLQHSMASGALLWAHYSRNIGSAHSEFRLFPVQSSISFGIRWRY